MMLQAVIRHVSLRFWARTVLCFQRKKSAYGMRHRILSPLLFVTVIFLFLYLFLYSDDNSSWTYEKSGDTGLIRKAALSPAALQHEITRRRDVVQSQCKRFNNTGHLNDISLEQLKHFIVDDDHRLLYCYVPKVACTNWKRVFFVLTGVRDEQGRPYRNPFEIASNLSHITGKLRTLDTYTREEAIHRLSLYYKLLVVRHPLERLLSAYINKFTMPYNLFFHRKYGTHIISRFRENPHSESLELGDDVTFSEFIQFLLDNESVRLGLMNEHWQSVHELCLPCSVDFDVIAKYETLEQDANYFLRSTQLDHVVNFPSLPSSYIRTSLDTVKQRYSEILRKHIRMLYRQYLPDFLLFNYSIPEYLLQ